MDKNRMITVLLASRDKALFSDMIDAFQSHGVRIDPAQSGRTALTRIEQGPYDLMITDEHLPDMTGTTLIKKAIALNPFMNCVAVSTLSNEEFHEAFEGLGVLMQFPPVPCAADVQNLLDHIDKIVSLSKK